MARIALGHVAREYPNKLDHVLSSDADALPPRALHPVFFGSFDWHSCVHGWWTLLTLRRLFPQIEEATAIGELARGTFTGDKVAAEVAYLDRPLSRGFERPYGWAWLLYLHLEATHHGESWGSELEPLARAFAQRLRDYLSILTYPIRVGTHFNTAFALILSFEWAEAFDADLAEQIRDRSRHWFGADRDCQAWEPGGDEFLSPALIEALCMARAHQALFPTWFEQFLPRVAARQPATLFAPAIVSDRSDGKIAHLDGLNLSRAWCWRALGYPEHAEAHLAAAMPHLAGDYMGEHWLASFALLALLAEGKAAEMTDVDALNRDFAKYDQVEKAHTYRLAEHEGDEFDDEYEIATLDIAPFLDGDAADKARFADAFGTALHEIGFAVLTGHGVDPALYDSMHDAVLDLFTSTPLADKMRFRAQRYGSVSQGYFPIEETSEIHPDLVEGWLWCRRAFDVPQDRDGPFRAEEYWPSAEYEREFRRLVLAHEPLFKPIAQAMFMGLGCDPHIYDRKLTGTNFGLRLNYYPPMSEEQSRSGAGRLLGHEDVDLFTILPAPRTDGLQVWNHRSGKWVRLSPPRGSIIINTGDYMQRISNDRLPSTTHRVGKPTDRSHLQSARVSFPMNVYVWEDEVLEVLPGLGTPKYPPIKAIAFHTRSTSKFYGDDYAVESA